MNTAARLHGPVTAIHIRDPEPALGSSLTFTDSPAAHTSSIAPRVTHP
ncbi:hypothetical protein ACWD3I_42335 [Streptomyces sp. NPDC002817]